MAMADRSAGQRSDFLRIFLSGQADGIILGPVSRSQYPPRDKGGINCSAHLRVVSIFRVLQLFAAVI